MTLANGQDIQPRILGVRVDPITVAQLHARIADVIESQRQAVVLHVNAHALNLAYRRSWLRNFLNEAEIVFPDGMGVVWAGRWLGIPLPGRITYADWLWQLAAFCEQQGYSLYFLGAKPGIALQAANNLRARYPGLEIAGTHHGYFAKAGDENARVVVAINRARPNILIVAFGMPLQEKWLYENWQDLNANVFLTGGACFDYAADVLERGPRLLTAHGFEWLARLLIEPRRLWKRYILGNPLFLYRSARQKLNQTIRNLPEP